MRFKELFKEFDRDRSGYLESKELRRLMQALMPNATEASCAYFEVCCSGLRRGGQGGHRSQPCILVYTRGV